MNFDADFERSVKAHYLDASALIKLLIDIKEEEGGRESLRTYFNANTGFHTTSLCFAEAFGVLKVKYFYKKEIRQEEYLKAVENLIWGKIEIDDVPIRQFEVFTEAKRLVSQYQIDLSDAMQIVTIMKGKYSVLCDRSKSILITADKLLAKAAREEGVRVWDCLTELGPE